MQTVPASEMHLFFPSRLKAASLVIGASVMVAAAGWIMTEDPALLMTRNVHVLAASCVAAMILYGTFAVRWARALFRVAPLLEIDADGIRDRRLGPDAIPWSAVRSIRLLDGAARPVLALSVDPPAGALSRTSGLRRYFAGGKDREGFWTVRVSLTGLDRRPETVLEAISRVLTARNRTIGRPVAAAA